MNPNERALSTRVRSPHELDHRSNPGLPPLLTVKEVSTMLRVSPSLVYGLVDSGKLSCFRIGKGRGAIRISQSDLENFLINSQQSPPAPQDQLRHPKLRHLKL